MFRPVLQRAGTERLVLFFCPFRPLVNRPQPLQGIVELGRQLDEHGGYLIGALQLRHVGRHRDGHNRHEGGVGKLVAREQVCAERPGAHGEDHIVHRGSHGVLHLLDVGQAGGGEGDPAPGVHGDIDGCARRAQRERRLTRSALPHPAYAGDGQGRAPGHAPDVDRSEEIGHQSVRHELEGGRDAHVELALAPVRGLRWIGHQVEQDAEELRPGHAVDRGVVHLGDECDLAVFERLDDPHLPQGPVTVQLPAGDIGRKVGELAHPPRRGQSGPPQVVVDIELGVIHPEGMPQPQGHLHQPALKDGHQGDPVDDHLADAAKGVAVGNGGGVEDRHHGHVHVKGGRLHVEETRIEPRQSFRTHRLSLVTGASSHFGGNRPPVTSPWRSGPVRFKG